MIKRNLITLYTFTMFLCSITIILPGCRDNYSDTVEGVETAQLTNPPYVPPPINRKHPTRVIVNLEVKEVVKRLADGVDYTFWTFGGTVPGKFIRVREGDQVEMHLSNNPNNKLPHNIDLHAVTGSGGGATASFTAPGHTSVFTFKAIHPGLFVYHCATAPVGMHIANGMYGLILVEPKEGLPPVDKEYYVMQSEFYTEGTFGEGGLQQFSMKKAIDEHPEYVVFNGSVGAIDGTHALKARVGESVRLFVGNGGPNLVSSFHIIGEIMEMVNQEGGTNVTQRNVQTTLIPAGGSAVVQFTAKVAGRFIIVDHSIFRAFNKGAIGMIDVAGKENPELFSGKIRDEVFRGSSEPNDLDENNANPNTSIYDTPAPSNGKLTKEEMINRGHTVFASTCMPCHQSEGQGLPNVFPPLAKSDFIANNKLERIIQGVINGNKGEMKVNGNKFNNIMPPQQLSDEQVAAVLTYIYNKLNNINIEIKPEDVKILRNK